MTHQNSNQLAPEAEVDDHAWNTRCDVRHKVDVAIRYHRKRQRFFDMLDKLTKTATVLLGASLMGALVKDKMPLIASAISSLGLLSLVFAYSDRKQAHKELAEAFSGLVQRIDACAPVDISQAAAYQWQSDYSGISAKEPPTLKTLAIICEYEASVATGHPNHVPRPFLLKRWVADFV